MRRDNRETQKNGEKIVADWFADNELAMTTATLDKLCDFHNVQKHEQLFFAVGEKSIVLNDKDLEELQEKKKEGKGTGWRKFVPFLSHDKKEEKPSYFVVGEGFNKKKPIIISEDNIASFIFPDCCHVIPGDDVLGYIDNKKRIEIHKRDCNVANRLKASFGNRILDAKWKMHKRMFFDATIEIHGIDRKGMLLDVSKVITSQLDINIHKITISSDKGIFDGTIELRVHDRSEVKVIVDSLMKIENLKEVQRIL